MRRLALAFVLFALPARADEGLARRHFKAGIELYDRGAYAEALEAFQKALAQKPSAGIEQNIGLTLKALGRNAEAASSFDRALERGATTLKPETRAAIERELAGLEPLIATVHLQATTEAKVPVAASITIEGPGGTRTVEIGRPVRLEPGAYVLTGHAAGFADPAPKKLAFVPGPPVPVSFVFLTPAVASEREKGTLQVTANVPHARIAVDGLEVGQGTWTGRLAPGMHALSVSAPGWRTATADVSIPPSGSVDFPIALVVASDAPPAYVAPTFRIPKRKVFSVAGGVALDTTSYRLGVPLGEPAPYGRRRGFGGLALSARADWHFTTRLSIELFGEASGANATYALDDGASRTTKLTRWQATPMLRFTTPGKIRVSGATGFGVHGLRVDSGDRDATGIHASWRLEGGMQFDAGPIFLEGALFLDVHGVGNVGDDAGRYLYASPATRGGIRFGLGLFL